MDGFVSYNVIAILYQICKPQLFYTGNKFRATPVKVTDDRWPRASGSARGNEHDELKTGKIITLTT